MYLPNGELPYSHAISEKSIENSVREGLVFRSDFVANKSKLVQICQFNALNYEIQWIQSSSPGGFIQLMKELGIIYVTLCMIVEIPIAMSSLIKP